MLRQFMRIIESFEECDLHLAQTVTTLQLTKKILTNLKSEIWVEKLEHG